MKAWWVSHGTSFKKELDGGYIWCPQVLDGDPIRQFWINVSLVKPGDRIFSYANQKIQAVGIATSSAYDAEPPPGYSAGGWGRLGWQVDVEWIWLTVPLQPKQHISVLAPLLPERYSPLRADGNGNVVYLAAVSERLYDGLCQLINAGNPLLDDMLAAREIDASTPDATTRTALYQARVGQGSFRETVLLKEPRCRMTGITNQNFLIASHIKPWAASNNYERLDGNNGLMLAPHVDRLFDKGWISFSDDGGVLVANHEAVTALEAWGLDSVVHVGAFSAMQMSYLAHHRDHVFGKCR
ncbi:MAG: hypothetical protein KER_03036 [Kerstersia gyiorum]|uniref:HNH endonuclease n=1 Tax=Kerstersia gyiorum TaxID=206506 RepID=UPI0030CBC2A3